MGGTNCGKRLAVEARSPSRCPRVPPDRWAASPRPVPGDQKDGLLPASTLLTERKSDAHSTENFP
eukprot:13649481-Alexandrium_andersonii.AAC.1